MFKLKFGHRGANHPVKNLITGKVEHHRAEPRLRGRSREAVRRCRGHADQPERRHGRGPAPQAPADLLDPVSPGGSAGPLDEGYLFKEFVESCDGVPEVAMRLRGQRGWTLNGDAVERRDCMVATDRAAWARHRSARRRRSCGSAMLDVLAAKRCWLDMLDAERVSNRYMTDG